MTEKVTSYLVVRRSPESIPWGLLTDKMLLRGLELLRRMRAGESVHMACKAIGIDRKTGRRIADIYGLQRTVARTRRLAPRPPTGA